MKTNIIKIILAVSVFALAGCTTSNPNYNASAPKSADNAPYIADAPKLAKAQAIFDKIGAVNDGTAAIDPYAPEIKWGLGIASTLLFGVSGLFARARSALTNTRKATQTLANVVATSGGQSIAMANAPDNTTAAIMASHFQESPLQTKTAVT